MQWLTRSAPMPLQAVLLHQPGHPFGAAGYSLSLQLRIDPWTAICPPAHAMDAPDMLDEHQVVLLLLAWYALFPGVITAALEAQQPTQALDGKSPLVSLNEPVFHFPSPEYITSTFFRMSLSCLSWAFSRSN